MLAVLILSAVLMSVVLELALEIVRSGNLWQKPERQMNGAFRVASEDKG
ncbi:hypothetical protein ACFSE1_02805 [Rhizobium helianthi]|uniref:Uncharacterized protein n=1 Tax=Rhizobium helianthi TaxID=1132695 RepID=A0ABW4LYW9_9HYPH